MGLFFIITFAITLLCILWLIAPLLKKNRANNDNQNIRVRPRFITSLLITLVIAIGGWLVYFSVGNVTIIEQIEKMEANANSAPEVDELITKLDNHLAENSDDLEGWLIKSRIEMSRGNTEVALEANKKAYALSKTDIYKDILTAEEKSEIIGRYVDTSVVIEQGQFSDNTHMLLEEALSLDPENPQVLWLSAMSYSQKGNHQRSVDLFTRAREIINAFGPNQPEIAQLDQLITAEKRLLKNNDSIIKLPADNNASMDEVALNQEIMSQVINDASSVNEPSATEEKESKTFSMPDDVSEILVEVTLSPELYAKASPDDTIFIIARPVKGSKAPLVAIKKSVSDLPISEVIDDSRRMLPFTTVAREVKNKNMTVVARITKSGNTVKQPGDIETSVIVHEWFEKGKSLPITLQISE